MKRILLPLILLLVVFGSCRRSSRKDHSLSLQEYQKMGVPDPNNIWTYKDYQYALAALTKLKVKQPFDLPTKDSKRSGAIFKRLINLENMTFLKDESIPLHEKAQMSKMYLEIQRELIDIYTNILMKKQYYNPELIDLRIFGLGVMQKMLDLAHQINKSDDPGDIALKYGYQSIQALYISNVVGALESQKNTSKYPQSDLEMLADTLSNSILRNKYWMDSEVTDEIKRALLVVMDSTSSEDIKNKYNELIESL